VQLDHRTPAPEEEGNACNFAEAEDSLGLAPWVGLEADRVRHRLEGLHAEERPKRRRKRKNAGKNGRSSPESGPGLRPL
jgi:hypothetical protein